MPNGFVIALSATLIDALSLISEYVIKVGKWTFIEAPKIAHLLLKMSEWMLSGPWCYKLAFVYLYKVQTVYVNVCTVLDFGNGNKACVDTKQ